MPNAVNPTPRVGDTIKVQWQGDDVQSTTVGVVQSMQPVHASGHYEFVLGTGLSASYTLEAGPHEVTLLKREFTQEESLVIAQYLQQTTLLGSLEPYHNADREWKDGWEGAIDVLRHRIQQEVLRFGGAA